MQIIATYGHDDLATVFVAKMRESKEFLLEFVDSIDPRFSRTEKQCIIVSTQYGCPINCLMCEAGGSYYGDLNVSEILSQISYVMKRRSIGKRGLNPAKLKIHFARMGEPALNPFVLDVLEILTKKYDQIFIIPCISTIAPRNSEAWFERLFEIKQMHYNAGNFQLQFSINATDPYMRDRLMPFKKWNLKEIANYGTHFYKGGQDRKVVLNFAPAQGIPIEPSVIADIFDSKMFIIKLTPLNPTDKAKSYGLNTILSPQSPQALDELVTKFNFFKFDVIVSIGAAEEIRIGSNCGQLVRIHRRNN